MFNANPGEPAQWVYEFDSLGAIFKGKSYGETLAGGKTTEVESYNIGKQRGVKETRNL